MAATGTAIRVAMALVLVPVLLFDAGVAYNAYWRHGAKRAVMSAADALAKDRDVPDLALQVDGSISRGLAAGYQVTGVDNIGLGFRSWEVMVRAAGGDQYHFDAYYRDGRWQLECTQVRGSFVQLPR